MAKKKKKKVVKKAKSALKKSRNAAASSSSKETSGEIGRWNGHRFIVSSKLIRGMEDLSIKGGIDTDAKTKKKQNYVARKNGQPLEISLTVTLMAATGCKVRDEALLFVSESQSGAKDYFYIARKKLVKCKLILTAATVKNVTFLPGGGMKSANVQLTLKQNGKGGKSVSGSSGSSGGSNKRSARGGGGSSSSGGGGSYGGSSSPTLTSEGTSSWLERVATITSNTSKNTKVKIKGKVGVANSEIRRNVRNAKRGTETLKRPNMKREMGWQ